MVLTRPKGKLQTLGEHNLMQTDLRGAHSDILRFTGVGMSKLLYSFVPATTQGMRASTQQQAATVGPTQGRVFNNGKPSVLTSRSATPASGRLCDPVCHKPKEKTQTKYL